MKTCFSADEGDRGRVYLNGIEISHVVIANEKERYLVRLKTDENGHVMLNDEETDVVRERITGTVVFEPFVPAFYQHGR